MKPAMQRSIPAFAAALAVWLAVGAGPVTSAFAQDDAAKSRPDYSSLNDLPDWTIGVWQPDWSRLFGAGTKPQFTPEMAKAVEAFNARKQHGENLQSAAANCRPTGMPGIMRQPYPIEFLFSPGRVTILHETFSQVRRIYTDGRALPDDPDPAFNGWSVGRWEGDVLVVDTNGLNPITSLMEGVHPTENTRIRERFFLTAPDEMTVETIITDPAIFAEPFRVTQAYQRKRDWQIREYVCEENNRDAADEQGRPTMNIEK